MRKIKLSQCGSYVTKERINSNKLNVNNYITTDNMLPNKEGICDAEKIPTNITVNHFQENDILLSNIRPYFKKIWKAEYEGGCSADVLIFRTNSGYNADFIRYCLSQDAFFDYDMKGAKGSKMPRGDKNHILNFELYDFSLPSQTSIASVLKVLDNKIILNNKINKELEQMAKTLYDYWFVQFDFPDEKGRPYKSANGKMVYNEVLKREIPDGWEVKSLKRLIKHINTGLNPRDNFTLGNGNIKYITVKNITENNLLDFKNCDVIDEVARDKVHNRSDIKVGDILFASITPLGRCYLIENDPNDWDINESVFSIRPDITQISSEYLLMCLTSEYFIKKASNSSTGSIFTGIRIKSLEDMPTIVPPQNIIKQFTAQLKLLLKKKNICFKENINLEEIRDFLLPLLMNGQVTVSSEH